MIVSHKHKFIFFKTRKTAGSSLQVALAEHCGQEDIITGQYRLGVDDDSHSAGLNMDKFFTSHPHPELRHVRGFLGEDIWNSYFKFAFVRNPYDIAVSRYHWNRKGKEGNNTTSVNDFREWVSSGNLFDKDQANLYIAENNSVNLDFIGYYENLEEDINLLSSILKFPKLNLPSLKGGFRSSSKYKSFYDDKTKKIVKDYYRKDFNLLGYRFDEQYILKRTNIITEDSFSFENDNIGTPCILSVDGKLLLYFSNHEGTAIKVAVGDTLQGPWTIKNVLSIEDTPCGNHIASPEVVLEDGIFKMFYHGNIEGKQGTFLAHSTDGLSFKNVSKEMLCNFYLKVFRYKNKTYGIAKNGNEDSIFYDVDNNFEPIFNFLPKSRHCHGLVKGDILYLTYSLMESTPEHIRLCKIRLHVDPRNWAVLSDEQLVVPTFHYEGAHLPVVKSMPGSATRRFKEPVCELRDPYLFEFNNKFFILYVTKGERAIAYAQLINYIE